MSFYKELSKYYDYIFPVGKEQINFISQAAKELPANLLDVACGSGGYAIELAKMGYTMTAIDIENSMVELTAQKAKEQGVVLNALQGDMIDIDQKVDGSFKLAFCIGNSIVHLGGISQIELALKKIHKLLDKDGILILQIINYDRVIKYTMTELPSVKNEQACVEFIRKYRQVGDKIEFNTTLVLKNNRKLENTVELFPLLSRDMAKVLQNSGFCKYEFYGDFNNSTYNDDSYMLVVKAYANG